MTTARGRLRVLLGAAPGVGKTYTMLEEGKRLLGEGKDVVIALVETHGRAATSTMTAGLEAVPRRTVTHRGVELADMDLDAVLARHPDVALVDELAHTNAPGSRNGKRWQDVEEILDAGIDVISTVNIQHIESLNDVVEQITRVPQRETVPDQILRGADRVEVVDLDPQALRDRLAGGDVYPAERIDAARSNYFRLGNLTALRELALLWLADEVDQALKSYLAEHGIDSKWETRERVVVALTGGPEGETLLRRGARIAARSAGGELLAVHVNNQDGLRSANPAELAGQRALLDKLGGSYRRRRPHRARGVRPLGQRDPARDRRQPPLPALGRAHRARHRRDGDPRGRQHRRPHRQPRRGRRKVPAAPLGRRAHLATASRRIHPRPRLGAVADLAADGLPLSGLADERRARLSAARRRGGSGRWHLARTVRRGALRVHARLLLHRAALHDPHPRVPASAGRLPLRPHRDPRQLRRRPRRAPGPRRPPRRRGVGAACDDLRQCPPGRGRRTGAGEPHPRVIRALGCATAGRARGARRRRGVAIGSRA